MILVDSQNQIKIQAIKNGLAMSDHFCFSENQCNNKGMNRLKEISTKYGPKAIGAGLNTIALVNPRKAAVKALDIFCTPRSGRVKSHQKKFLAKFSKKMLPFGDIEIATYEYKGTGPKILLCHGWESNSFRWRKLFKKLQEDRCHVIMMDAPAHGATGGNSFTALLYAEMIDVVAQQFTPQIICGHSVGGMASIMYLSKYQPSYLKTAVILASPDRLSDITDNYFGIIGGSKRLRQRYDRLMPEIFGHDISYFSAASFAASFTIPALIVHDKEDTINKYEEGERIHQAWQGSTLEPTQQLGHSLQSEQVFETISKFISKQKLTKV